MVHFSRFTLANGLRFLVHEDAATPMAVLNILYDVGARDEDPDKTGFAHLFEHLMFGGSVHIPQFDTPLQRVGGENNAFTSNDITNYYISVPAVNLETAFWLESDRMLSLAFSEKSLETQRQVVSEEFKQRYLNQPYGDVWLKLRPLAYHVHPYQWATIGKELAHIEDASMADVKAFFRKYYLPNNAIVVVAGNVKVEEVKLLAEKWFGPIPAAQKPARLLPAEPEQTSARRQIVRADVPLNSLYIAFHIPGRLDPAYYTIDLITDLFSRGQSSRLYRHLVKDLGIFTEIHAYQVGSMDPGLFIIEGKPAPQVVLEEAEAAIWHELETLKNELVPEEELQKVKNKIESTLIFSQMNVMEKAMSLAFYELLGDAGQINQEADRYLEVSAVVVQEQARQIFRKENSSTLIYLPLQDA